MTESYEDHQKRMNRERQRRFYAANKDRIKEQKIKDRADLKAFREGNKPASPSPPTPATAPVVQRQVQPEVVANNRLKIKVKKVIFSENVVIQKLKEYPMDSEATRDQYIKTTKKLFRITGCPDLGNCLKNFEKIKNEIETAKQVRDPTEVYGLNSKKTDYEIIVWLIDHFEIKIPLETKQKYKEIFAIYKVKSVELQKKKQANEETVGKGSMPPVNTITNKVEKKYGEDSKQFLIVLFYKNAPMRDDFGSLIVVQSLRKNDNTNQNYVVVPRQENQKCTLVIQKYKTDKLYGILKFQLDQKTSTLLRNYIKKKKVEYDSRLFPEYKNGKMSSYISNFMKSCGFVGDGGVNFLRHAIFSEDVNGRNLSAEEIVRLSHRAGHSVVAHYGYVRKVVDM